MIGIEIRGIAALRNHAFEIVRAADVKERLALRAVEVLYISQAIRAALQDPSKNVLSLNQRVPPQVVAVMPEAIEGVEKPAPRGGRATR